MRRWLPTLVFLGVAAATSAACKAKAGGECKTEAKLACEDATTALACHGGKWERETCRGPSGCAQKGSDAECDHATAENGDACSVEGDHSCTADKKAMVRCAGYRWGIVATCLGPAGCVRGHDASCDNSSAAVDDPCTKEGDIACTLDAKATLTCTGG